MPKSTQKVRPSKTGKVKPKKPYGEFPLSPHASGAWQKKILGKTHYFGRWGRVRNGKMERLPDDGWRDALTLFKAQADDLYAGRTPRDVTDSDSVTMADICNEFLKAKDLRSKAGELARRTFKEYKETTDRLINTFGKNRRIDDLRPRDFTELRAAFAAIWGPVRVGNKIQSVRTVFKFAFDNDLIEKPMRFGSEFKKPSKSVLRKHRNSKEKKLFTPDEVNELLSEADLNLKAMILLGINCGMGNSDCGSVTRKSLCLESGWVDFPRPKTGVKRRCPLWSETIEVLKEVVRERPTPKEQADADLVFVTKYGNRWVRATGEKGTQVDSVGLQFGKLMKKVGNRKKGLGFYALRHTFRTVADATRDFPAVRLIMGHADSSIDDVYREHIDDDRLLCVSNCVRDWLMDGTT